MLVPSRPVRADVVRNPAGVWADESDAADPQPPARISAPEMERALEEVLARFGLTDVAVEMLEELASQDPKLYFAAGLARLSMQGGVTGHRKRSLRLFDTPTFLLELVRSDRFSPQKLKAFCAQYVQEDALLDVKLARLMPGRSSDEHHLETNSILKLLDVLDVISPGPRLLMIIGHLTQHLDQHVASKATLLVGRRLQSQQWVERHLTSSDSRVRASVTEALWSVHSALAAKTFRLCLEDENNRVCGNALIGLHLLGDRNASSLACKLTKDRRPLFRQTAAWVIGKMDDPELIPVLEALLEDSEDGVRQSATRALESIHRPVAIKPEEGLVCDAKAAAAAASIQADKTAEALLPETAIVGQLSQAELAPAVEPVAVLSTSEPATDATPEPKPVCIPFALRLDGRYITGD